MLPDENGNMLSAGFFINWGDYLHVKLQNPTGLLTVVDSLKITDKLLVPILLVGPLNSVKKLVKGAAYKFRKEHKVHITVLNGASRRPLLRLQKRPNKRQLRLFCYIRPPRNFRGHESAHKDAAGNVRLFIETPMLVAFTRLQC